MGDSEELARRLVTRFGSLARALEATPAQLSRIEREDRAVLAQIRSALALAEFAARESLARAPVVHSDPGFHQFLRVKLAHLQDERLHATFLDSADRYLADEIIAWGDARSIALPARALVCRALELDADAVILAHNHPSGNCEPSAIDVAATRHTAKLLASLDIRLVDHFVIGHEALTSMKLGGCL